jgi:glycerol-3-phosphate O-acyltransferase/dihydroxyacetone phosphate acyltransferase
MKQKAIKFFAKLIHPSKFIRIKYKPPPLYLVKKTIVPVMRPQDLAETGTGRIHLLNPKTDPLRIIGIDTRFTQQLTPTDSLILPKNAGKCQIEKIISDTELLLKSPAKDPRTLAVLTKADGTAYKCLPHIDQDGVYERVYDELNNGRCITIFPEGGSHDRAELLPFKAGVTIMALGAMAKYPGLDVKIVPCGKNEKHLLWFLKLIPFY